MKVLHFCMSRGWGGLEMASAQWAGLFHRHGHESYSICAPNSPLTKRLIEMQLPYKEMAFREYFSPLNSWALHQWLKDKQIDAIFLQSLRDLWTVSPALAGLPHIKLVGFAQMWLEGINKKDFMHTLVHKRMDRLITLTPRQSAQVLRCIPFDEKNTVVLPNSIDPLRFSPSLRSQEIRQSFGASPKDILIGIVGRLDRQKGQREAIEAFAQARVASPDTSLKLVLVGDPTADSGQDYLDELKKVAHELKVDEHVVFAGFRSDIPQIMASLDIFLLNSYREAFGFVIVEAMMSGTAVIATNSGGVPDVLNEGQYGILVPPQDTIALASAFTNLSRNSEFRGSLSQKARAFAMDHYDENKNFAKMMDILDGIRR